MDMQTAIFVENKESILKEIKKLLTKKMFLSLWKENSEEEKTDIRNENPSNICKKIKTFLQKNFTSLDIKIQKGFYEDKVHEWIIIQSQEEPIVVDVKKRKFNDFFSRLNILESSNKEYSKYSIKKF